ncbi:MAG: DinB family protein [Thermomicrobiales bacterium]
MLDDATRNSLIAQYEDGYRAVADALDGITDDELDAREASGEWSPRQVVHHLADSEMRSALRLRELLVADRPTITAYDQEEYARVLHYDRPIAPSLAAFRAARDCTVPLLHRMTPEDWSREGAHVESGSYRVEDWLRIYAAHAHDHADQIRRARAAASLV